MEVQLEDAKEESKYFQPVSISEVKLWNQDIKKEVEMVKKEQKNAMNNPVAPKREHMAELKTKAEEIKRLKQAVEDLRKESDATIKQNKKRIREKENQVLSAKNNMNQLIDRLEECNKRHKVNLHKVNNNERIIKLGLYDNKGISESQMNLSYTGPKAASIRGSHSQYRASNYSQYQKGSKYKRDLSAVNTRNVGRKYGKNFNSNYLNNSTSETDNHYGASSRKKPNKLKSIKNNSSVIYGKDKSSKLEINHKKADASMGDIKIADQRGKRESDNIKAHRDRKDSKDERVPSAKDTPESKELGELKGIKVGKKKKIETSVKL